uniref:Putative salivary protein of 15kda inhibits cd4+ t cell activation n=1 Tax=Ixodes ricinus TaxID=34613 RepID=A0A090X8A2_IXORI
MKLAAGVIIVALLLLILEEGISSKFIASGDKFPHMQSRAAKRLRSKLNKKCGYSHGFSFAEIDFSTCQYKCRRIGTNQDTYIGTLDEGTSCGNQGQKCQRGQCVAKE